MSKLKKEIPDDKSAKPSPFQKFLKKELPQETDDAPRAKRKRISKGNDDSPFAKQDRGGVRSKKENPFGDKKPSKTAIAPARKFANPFEPKHSRFDKKPAVKKENPYESQNDYFDIKKNKTEHEEAADGRKKFYSGLSESKKKFEQGVEKKKFEFGSKSTEKRIFEKREQPLKDKSFEKKEIFRPGKIDLERKGKGFAGKRMEKPEFVKRETPFKKEKIEKTEFSYPQKSKFVDKDSDYSAKSFDKKKFEKREHFSLDKSSDTKNEVSTSKKTLLGDDFFAKSHDESPAKIIKERKPKSPPAESDVMRLNKFVAQTGLCSRRKAAELIKEGHIFVNGIKEINPAYEMQKNDVVKYNSKEIKIEEKKVYLVMNKPKNVITTSEDEKGRKTVLDLIQGKFPERIYPVGRLDRNTTGLLLLTNDGDLSKKLSHPSHMVKKIYHVVLDKNLKTSDLEKIKEGIQLEDGVAEVDEIYYIEGAKKNELGVEIHSGKNRIVRRIFESLNYGVEKLDRTYFAGLTKKDLPRGFTRELTEKEVIMLKHFTNRRKGE